VRHDLFITDLWIFDFPYHQQFKPQVLEHVSSPEVQDHIERYSSRNPSLYSYGGDEVHLSEERTERTIISFFQTQVFKLLKEVEKAHDWETGEWGKFIPWLNINQKGNFNPPHIHPGNDYSGVYYLCVPQDSGLIHFLDPRSAARLSSPDPKTEKLEENWYAKSNPYDSSIFSYQPEEGKIIIFPSWLMHYSDPNRSEDLRISMPFNSKYEKIYVD